MKSFRVRLASVLLTAAAVGTFAAGCSSDDDDDVFFPTNQGQLAVQLTDAEPLFDQLEAVDLNLTRVDVIGNVTSGTTGTVVPLFIGSNNIDVLPLRGGQTALIAQNAVPAGEYETVRLWFNSAAVDYNVGGTTQTFSTANGLLTVTGVDTTTAPGNFIWSLDLPANVVVPANETRTILVDLDLEESLDLQPDAVDPATMTFTPIGRARTLAEAANGGSIRGVVTSDNGTAGNTADDTPINNASVRLLDSTGTDTIALTRTDALGAYVIPGVEAGDYQLEVAADGFTTQTFDTTVVANQQTTQDAILTPTAP